MLSELAALVDQITNMLSKGQRLIFVKIHHRASLSGSQ
jgi:hypothetical protein